MNEALRNLALAQGGAFRYGQAVELQGRETLRRDLRSGLVLRVRRGHFRIASSSPGLIDRFRALQDQVDTPLVACGVTAAELHGFTFQRDPRLHVTAADGSSVHLRGDVVVRQKRPIDMRREHGILVTSCAETTVDLTCAASGSDVLRTLDEGRRAGASVPDLLDIIDASKGRRGIIATRDWTPWSSTLSESPAESWVRQRLIADGFTDVECQIEQWTPSGFRRIDLGWRAARVGVEYDGEEFHAGNGALLRDRRRMNELIDAGWIIIHLVRSDLANPITWLKRVRRALESRDWQPPATEPPPWPLGRRGLSIPR